MPHLSELQKKYAGKVNVIGVNIWEEQKPTDNSYFSKIDKYIADMGDQMTYTVAADGYEGKLANSWMTASGAQGIPTSFIVGKDGTILWIGHPMGLDKPLEEILAGKYDLAAATARDKQRRDTIKAQNAVFGPIRDALNAGDNKKAVAAIDAAVAKDPNLAVNLGLTKFNILLRSDEPAAMAWAKEFAEGAAKDNPNVLNTLAWTLVDDKSPVKKPDYAVAVSIAERGERLVKADEPFYPYIADTLAYAYYKNNQLDKAIELQGKALASAEKIEGFDEETLKEIRDRLEMFKKKKAGG